jgi:hypothetical protein
VMELGRNGHEVVQRLTTVAGVDLLAPVLLAVRRAFGAGVANRG